MMGSAYPSWSPGAFGVAPGVCEVPLTRAFVLYRPEQEHSGIPEGGRDLGVALVLDGRNPSRAASLDLGSGIRRLLDLSTSLSVMEWLHPPVFAEVEERIRTRLADASTVFGREAELLRSLGGGLLHSLLERTPFGALVRPTLMRIAFRDIAEDLDPHQNAAVRILLGPGRVARVHLDADHLRLLVRTGSSSRDPALETALGSAFPSMELRRSLAASPEGTVGYQVLLTAPATPSELRELMLSVRRGVERLVAHFEADRFLGLQAHVGTLGPRDTLAHIRLPFSRAGAPLLANPDSIAEVVH